MRFAGKELKVDIAVFALIVSVTSASISYCSMRGNVDAQRAALFSQFQAQYNDVHSRFPEQHRQPDYRPAPGSDEYARLEAYWFFCFSEWYATHRVNAGAYRDLWDDYYVPLVGDGVQINSLRYVLENRI